ncbi:MAG: hypothetical protein K6E20_03170 [Acholeplasmatales bacterium]|nr:hypothetical protein [Acholeplasmatales bacterium]
MDNKFFECHNCGNQLSASDKECKYCGQANPHYKEPAKAAINISFNKNNNNSSNFNNNNSSPSQNQKRQISGGEILLFIILLLACGPFGIIYLIYLLCRK